MLELWNNWSETLASVETPAVLTLNRRSLGVR
jgi:hypothetical protein